MELTRGTQILYVPMHAHGDAAHPDVEAGFVTSVRGDTVFCRYWSKYTPGELRTKANSEGTPVDAIVIRDTVPQAQVDAAFAEIETEVDAAAVAILNRYRGVFFGPDGYGKV